MSLQARVERWLTWLVNPVEAGITFKYQYDDTTLSNRAHVKLAADWLLRSQAVSGDGGFSRKYNLLLRSWDKSYIETTGYIIPTLFKTAKYLNDVTYRESALRAVDFLMSTQSQSGAFCDIDSGTPHVFDTGQCLLGLISAYQETSDERILQSAAKAGSWLQKVQETDGSWVKGAYQNQSHTYYSRVASALIELGKMDGNDHLVSAGDRHIEWVLKQQKKNGFFYKCGFSEEIPPYLHTMVYVLEGLLKTYQIHGVESTLESALRNSEKLADINFNREILLSSQYKEDYSVFDSSRCITGLCQWAGVCVDLYNITKQDSWLDLALRTAIYLKARQLKEGKNLCGGHPGSIPVNGSYAPNVIPNWNSKFFIDAIIKLDKAAGDSLSSQLEEWVAASFSFQAAVVTDHLCLVDKGYMTLISDKLKKLELNDFSLVDIGCGKGKFVQQLQKDFPALKCFGLDPYFSNVLPEVQNGSVGNTGLDDNSVNGVLCVEVLQHAVDLNIALKEIRRILKKDGVLFICDRNPVSILGVLKPFREKKGRWMYAADSPFRERWYSSNQWRQALDKENFLVEGFHTLNNPEDKIKNWNRYNVIVARAL